MAEFWSNNDRGYRLRLWIDQLPHNQNNISNNNSQVRIRLALLNTTTTFSGYSCSAYVDLNGQRLNWSDSPNMTSYNSTIMLIDQTITVGHNADGKKTFGFSASFSGSGGWSPGTLSIENGSFTLTTIPRTSSVTGQKVAVGSDMSITIKRASSSFTHTLRYGFGSKSGTIATGVATSTTWAVPINFAEEIPNGTSSQGTIWCDTYSGNTKIGTSHYIFTVTVPNTLKPTIGSIELLDTNTAARSLLSGNNFLQIISNVQVDFIGSKGIYGSTIVSYKAEIVNRNLSTTENGGTLGIMNFNGSATIRASVVDSRGRQSDTKDITINVIEYFAPILSFTALRTSDNPNTIKIVRNAKIAPITLSGKQKNVMSLKFKVAPFGSSTYTFDNGSASGSWPTQHSFSSSPANMAGNYLSNKSYTIVGILSDNFTSTEFATTVATESVVMSYDKNGRVGIGKVVEQGKPGSLDVAGDMYANGKPIQQHQLTNNNGRSPYHASGTVDLNTKTVNSFFSCNEPKNGPSVGTGLNQFYIAVYSESDNYLSQNAIQKNSGRMFTRTRHNGNWTAWTVQGLDSFYPVGSIYQSTSSANPATFMGGTWERFANGRVLIGVDETDVDFNISNKFGGSKTTSGLARVGSGFGLPTNQPSYAGRILIHNTKNTSTAETSTSLNNLQPYVTIYRWRRTA